MRLYNMRTWCKTSVGRSRGKDDVNSPDVRGSPTTRVASSGAFVPTQMSSYCSDITIDLVHPYHRCSANYPYGRSCPLSPALSPTSIYSVRFFPGNMRYAESHISSSSLVRNMCFGSVSSSASLPIQSVPSPGLSYKTTTFLIAGYAVLPFRWVS